MSSAPTARPRSVPLPRTWGARPRDVVALLLANGVFIVLMRTAQGPRAQTGFGRAVVQGSRAAHSDVHDAVLTVVSGSGR